MKVNPILSIHSIEYLFKRIWLCDKIKSHESRAILNTLIKSYQFYRFYKENY